MIRISIGDKVKLKSDDELYIVEGFARNHQISVRKYYQECTRQIDVTRDDVRKLHSNTPAQNNTENADDAMKRKREMESRSQFLEFRKKFFKIPSETIDDPFYFCLIPNMTVLMILVFSLNLLVISIPTVLFCLCPLVFDNSFWCAFWQTVLCYFGWVLPFTCGTGRALNRHMKFTAPFKRRFVGVLSNIVLGSFLSMKLKPVLSSSCPIYLPHMEHFVNILFGNLLRRPFAKYFVQRVLPNIRKTMVMLLEATRSFSQIVFIQFWIWGPPNISRALSQHRMLSCLIILILLKVWKYGNLGMSSAVLSWVHPDNFYATQFRCLLLALFVEVLVMSNVTLDEFFVLVFLKLAFDIWENFYHVSQLCNQGDPTGNQETKEKINKRSSYVFATEIATIIVPLYFCIAILIFGTLDQSEKLWFLGAHTKDTFTAACVGPMPILVIMAISNVLIMSKMVSRRHTFMAHARIYLMENEFEQLFVTPLVLVGYLLISCHFFGK